MKTRLVFCLMCLALANCASAPTLASQSAAFVEAERAPTHPTVAAPAPARAHELPERAPPQPNTRPTDPIRALAAANGAARQHPSNAEFHAARQIYRYEAGALYELYANPNFISTILLEPGETLIDIAAGDTARWMVSQSVAEADQDARVVVLVKPQAQRLRTNIVLVTDRRTYLIEAIAQSGDAYAAQIAWSYPALGGASAPEAPLEGLYLEYRVRAQRGQNPLWTPRRVYDDGRRTWIEFAPEAMADDLPPLFVLNGEGAAIVNYRVVGASYVVDRVFDVAELRYGARNPVVVRIERRTPRRRT